MDLDELIEEHKNLIKVLESKSHKDEKKEAKKQKKELQGYKKQKKTEDSKIEKSEDDGFDTISKAIEFDGKTYNFNVKQELKGENYGFVRRNSED